MGGFLLEVGTPSPTDKISPTPMRITDYYVTSDAMGSVTTILDEDGNILERRSYDAFGDMSCMLPDSTPVASSPTGVDVGFQGQVREEFRGLYQMGYRWHNPVLGRWLSRDPIGLDGGVNWAAFAGDNPISLLDPRGELFTVESIQTNGGTTVTVGKTAREFKEAITKCEDGSILKIKFTGHANGQFQGLDDADPTIEQIAVFGGNNDVHLQGKSLGFQIIPLKTLLNGKMRERSKIILDGCNTACNENSRMTNGTIETFSISKRLSEQLGPGIKVEGHRWAAFNLHPSSLWESLLRKYGLSHKTTPIPSMNNTSLGPDDTYIDGVRQ